MPPPSRRAALHPFPKIPMKKLALNLDQLAVESFATDAAERPAGTVRGNGISEEHTICITNCGTCTICPGCYSDGGTCDLGGSCANTCQESCNCPTFAGETCELTCYQC